MDAKALNQLLNRLPFAQRETAQKKITQAISFGWKAIALDSPEGAIPHHYDLMGTHPMNGRRELLPEPGEEAED